MGGWVLVVDDDPFVREAIEVALALNGYRVIAAPDGRAALAHLRADLPDLVITDLVMPGLDGFGLATEMGARGLRPRVGLVVMTARGSAQEDAHRTEADGYLTKPFEMHDLLGLVDHLVGR
jgi:DNA-binding response OmpR family regulator